jgi:hypothetical protein
MESAPRREVNDVPAHRPSRARSGSYTPARRDHLGHNGTVAPPAITVTCDCGRTGRVQYGERFECECGRAYTTEDIPEADYAAIRTVDRRYRRIGWAGGLAFAAVILFVTLTQPFLLLAVVPAGMLGWFGFVRPVVRRRHWQDVQALTRSWKLRPAPPRSEA